MNIIDYVLGNNRKFSEDKFNHVDALVLSQLIYCGFDIVANGEHYNLKHDKYYIRDFFKAEYFDRLFPVEVTKVYDRELLTAVTASRRFRDIRLRYLKNDFDPDSYKQFSCGIFAIDSNTDFVAFRGTDSSIVGWKEDFNLSFMNEVPSQRDALDVLNAFYKNSFRSASKIIVGGHSKGGNLAVYAASFAAPEVRKRIIRVYSMDGPGFREDVKEKMNQITPALDIIKIVPKKSLIGMLMETGSNYLVVESDGFFIMQHMSYNWVIDDNDFVYTDQITRRESVLNNTISDWLLHASDQDRETVINAIFDIIQDNDIEYTSDFSNLDIRGMISSTQELSEEQELVIKKMFGELVTAGIRQKGADIHKRIKNKLDSFTE